MLELIWKNWPAESQLLGYVVLLIWFYFKLKGQNVITRKMLTSYQTDTKERFHKNEMSQQRIDGLFAEHRDSEAPHINCPAHGEAIAQIEARLNRIQNDIAGVRSELTELNRTLLLIATNSANMAEKKRIAMEQG